MDHDGPDGFGLLGRLFQQHRGFSPWTGCNGPSGLGEALEFCGALQSIHGDLGGSTSHAREAGWMLEPVGTCWNLLGMQKDLKIMRLRVSECIRGS